MTEAEQRRRLCRLDDLGDPGSRGFSLRTAAGLQDIFVVRRGEHICAYANSCPHTGGPLDWQPHQFLSLDGDLIQCATHLALFRIDDGRCVAGPCVGRTLTPVPLALIDGWVLTTVGEVV